MSGFNQQDGILHVSAQQGFSLVELMVSIVIGSIILVAIMYMFAGSKSSYRSQIDLSAIQENGRYAIHSLTNDLHLAGYWGLTYDSIKIDPQSIPNSNVSGNCLANTGSGNWVDVTQYIFGSETNPYASDCIPASEYMAGTDILVVRGVESGPDLSGPATPVAISLPSGLDNTLLVVSELDEGSLNTGSSLNGTTPDASPYSVHKMLTNVYYIRPCSDRGTNSVCDANDDNGNPIPTLVRLSLVTGPAMQATPLVEGIESMQFTYGVDTDSPPDGNADRYVAAGTLNTGATIPNWRQVVSVRLDLLVRSLQQEGGYNNDLTYTIGNVTFGPANDMYRRKVYSSTVHLRNYRRPGA